MRRWLTIPALALSVLLTAGLASAQSSDDDEDEERDVDNYALAVGVGLVEPSDAEDTETYVMAALRIAIGGRDEDDGGRGRRGDHGVRGFLEPEIGYWKTDVGGDSATDLLLGANLIGVIPIGNVESFFGVGAGLHRIDTGLLDVDDIEADSDTQNKVGVNAQFGIDIFMTEHLSAFGTGRFDLVEDTRDSLQTKVYLGLRGRF